jgi:dihydrofolate synthase/folylpolyglutamate synthase
LGFGLSTPNSLTQQTFLVTIDSLLEPFQQFGVNLGLSRMIKLLEKLGNPHHQVPVIHVAGTNGKGSVCAYLSSVLTASGYTTGRYTSPHLVDWTERICVNELPINTDDFCQLISQVIAVIDGESTSPTQFEVITAAAWLYFAQQKVDLAVIEVGLGGRLDATNVCAHPLVTVITSIGRDHWRELGSTLADIAREKAGILKPESPSVVGPLPDSALSVVRSRAQALNCPLVTPQPAQKIHPGWAEYDGIQYPLPLHGEIQLINSALAIATLLILKEKGWQISDVAIAKGMAKTNWPGRMDWVTWKNQRLLIDGAHNPPAAQVLRDYVDSLTPSETTTSTITWVIGMLATKDHAEIFQALLHPGDKLYLVPVPESNSANLGELEHLAAQICPDLHYCHTYSDLFLALTDACMSTKGLVVLCGSLYLLGYFLQNSRDNFRDFPNDCSIVEPHQ